MAKKVKKSFGERFTEFKDSMVNSAKQLASEGRKDRKSRQEKRSSDANAKLTRATAYREKKEGQARKLEAKARLAEARQGYKKTAARMAALSSLGKSWSDAESNKAKYGAQSAPTAALATWQQLINNNATPAEGTGDSNSGDSSGSGSSTTVAPVD